VRLLIGQDFGFYVTLLVAANLPWPSCFWEPCSDAER